MTRTHRRTTDERRCAAAPEAFTAEGAPAAPAAAADGLESRMKALLVSFDGVRYVRNGFRHDQVSDAVACANLMLSRPAQFDKGSAFPAPPAFSPPREGPRTPMATLGIGFVEHAYRFEGFRYGQLSDAVACATQSHAAHRPDPA